VPTDRDETLSEAFWGVARQLRQASRETLLPWDLSPSHSRALGELVRHGDMRLSDLADHLHIAPRSTTEVVDALQERALVERRADLTDRRATVVTLTDQGRQVGDAIKAARTAEAERFFGHLSDTDRAQLARILRKLRD
jgi:DNA-binding MarR family transcriptional regulator